MKKIFFKLQILNADTKTNHVNEVLADNRIIGLRGHKIMNDN